jgi:hypothetical protein
MNMMNHMNMILGYGVPKNNFDQKRPFWLKNKLFYSQKWLISGSPTYIKFILDVFSKKTFKNSGLNEPDVDECTRVYIAVFSIFRHFLRIFGIGNEHAKFIQVHRRLAWTS